MMVENAKIVGTTISMADHGLLTFFLILKGQGWGVSFGGRCIGKGYLGAEKFEGYDKGLECLMRIMDTIGVERWEDLEGKLCRVESHGWGGDIHKIGNIIEDKWFDLNEFFDESEVGTS